MQMAQDMFLEQLLTKQQTDLRKLDWQPPEAPPQEHPQAAASRFQSLMWDGRDGVRELLLQYARSGSAMAMGVVLGLAEDHGCSMSLAFCNKLLFTISTSGSLEASYTVLQWMSAWGHQPDSSSYSHVLMTAVARFDAATVRQIATFMRDNGMPPSPALLRHALLITYARLHWGTSARGLELRRALAIHQEMWLHFLLEVGVPMYSSALKLVVGQVARGLEDLQVEPLPATAEWVAHAAQWAFDSEEAWVQDPVAARLSGGSQIEASGAELQLMARLRAAAGFRAMGQGPGAKVAEFEAQPAGPWTACGREAASRSEAKDWTHSVSMAWADECGQSDGERWSTAASSTDEDTDEYGQSDSNVANDAALRAAPPPALPDRDLDRSQGCDQVRPGPQSPSTLERPHQGFEAETTRAPRGRRGQVRFADFAEAREPGSDEEAEAERQTSSQDLRRCYLEWLHSQPRRQQDSLYSAYQKWQIDHNRQGTSALGARGFPRSASF